MDYWLALVLAITVNVSSTIHCYPQMTIQNSSILGTDIVNARRAIGLFTRENQIAKSNTGGLDREKSSVFLRRLMHGDCATISYKGSVDEFIGDGFNATENATENMIESATENGKIRYLSLSSRRESLDTAISSVLEELHEMIDLIAKTVEDPLAIPELTEFIKKHETVAASYMMILAYGYEHEKALYMKQTTILHEKFLTMKTEKNIGKKGYQALNGQTDLETETFKDHLGDKKKIIQNLQEKIATVKT